MAKPLPITETIQRGYTSIQLGVSVGAVSATAAFPLTITAEKVIFTAHNANTDTVWLGLTSTVNSATGYPLYSGTVLELPYRAGSLTYWLQSQGGSSVVSYVALGRT
jgi:hypothetical protein